MYYLPQTFLYELIDKLKPKQKRDFLNTLLPNFGEKSKTNYQILFEEMCKVDKHNETNLKKSGKDSMNDEVLSVVKNKLTERLLTYLCDTSHETTLKRLHRWLDFVEFLFTKEMFDEAATYCRKIKKEALRNDLHTIIIEANRWESRCLPYIERDNYQQSVLELRKESKRSLEMISRTDTIRDYYHEVMGHIQQHFNLRNTKFRDDLEGFMKNPLFALDANDPSYSFLPASYLAMTKHFLYKLNGNFEMAYKEERIVWNRLQQDFDFYYKSKRAETIGAIINYLEALSKTDHTDIFKSHMGFIEKMLVKKEKGNCQLETALRLNQLNYIAQSKKEALTKKDILPFERVYKSGIADKFIEFKRIFECYLANACFLVRDYEKAISYNEIALIENKLGEVRSDNYEYARINELVYKATLIISHGLKNDDIPSFESLAYAYSEIIRHKPETDDYSFELALAKFFRSLKQNTARSKVLERIDKLEKELDEIFSQDIGYLKLIRINFDYPFLMQRWREYLL